MLIFEMGLTTQWDEERIAIEQTETGFVMVMVNAPHLAAMDLVFDRFRTRCDVFEALQRRLQAMAVDFPALPVWLSECCESDRSSHHYDVYEEDDKSVDLFVEDTFAVYLRTHLLPDPLMIQAAPFLSYAPVGFQNALFNH